MLKSLELFGFKSFADRTRFDFDPGITGVVGPNGSGKSNVVDAIKWILGDQSAKSLRGKEMADVIFNGAAGRKPNSFAEATLTFDNSTGFLPIDSQEVLVGRRLWRNGDAEYLINRGVARLKDVRDLFMGTGAGASAYCIIEQGRVDQILQANPTSRRLVFEEAAGISRYKARKVEAGRKLERVEQNLLRLRDIVDEVDAQRTSLRSQAEKAARFRDLSKELKELWLGLAADDHRTLSNQLEQIEEAISQQTAEIDALNGRQQELERRLSSLDGEISTVDDQLRDAERGASQAREAIASHQTTIRHQTSRKRELNTEITRLRVQRTAMRGRLQEGETELEHVRKQLERFEAGYAGRHNELQNKSQQIRQLQDTIDGDKTNQEARRAQLMAKMKEVSSSESRVTAIGSQLESIGSSGESAEQKCRAVEVQLDDCREQVEAQSAKVGQAAERVSAAEDAVAAILEKRHSLSGNLNEFQQRLAEQREQRSGWLARKSVLEDLERKQEGLGIGVKEILSRARTSDYAPWNQIRGSVADLLDVDLEHAALLEVALGDRAQWLVIDEIESLVEYLSSGTSLISGRVGFVTPERKGGLHGSGPDASAGPDEDQDSADGQQPGPLRESPDLSNRDGVLHRANRLIRSSSECPPRLADRLLGDTWVVETLKIAQHLSDGDGRGCRFVTLQGEMLDAEGTLYVGTVRSESALVSRKSELRRLKNDLRRLDERIEAEQADLDRLVASLGEVDDEIGDSQAQQRKLEQELTDLKTELGRREGEFERLTKSREAADGEVARIREQEQESQGELETTRQYLTQAQEELSSLQSQIETSEREIAEAEQQRQTLDQQLSEDRLGLAKQEERLEGLRSDADRLIRELETRLQQRDEADRRFESGSAKRREITLQILNASSQLAERFLEEEASASRASAFVAEKATLREQREQLDTQQTSVRSRRRQLEDTRHTEEIKIRDLRHQLNALSERIEEEYQVSLPEVVESGASAIRAYREEQQAALAEVQEQIEEPESEPEMTGDDENISSAGESVSLDDEEQDTDEENSDDKVEDEFEGGPADEEIRDELEDRINRLRRKLKVIGSVNTDSLHTLDELEQRYDHLSQQLADLEEAKETLEEIVRRINSESKRLFEETFESICGHFRELFRKLFGGGEADIVLEDPDDILDCSIDIVARPPGKELRSISLLSGGEKTLTAVAMSLAIFKSRPSPFCILDEVDAALDEANVDRFVSLVGEFRSSTQFIMITHSKRSMAAADLIYGVTMEQSGVSKRLSVQFDDVREDGNFAVNGKSTVNTENTIDRQTNDAA